MYSLNRRTTRTHLRGFTLIELIVVVIILAVLAAIGVVSYNHFVGDAHDAAVLTSAHQMADAVNAASAENGDSPSAEMAQALATVDTSDAGQVSAAIKQALKVSSAANDTVSVDDATSPTSLNIAEGSHAACVTLATDDNAATAASGACAFAAQSGDTGGGTLGDRIAVGGFPNAIAITSDGKTAYVSNFVDDTISVITVATKTATDTIPVGPSGMHALVVSADGKTLYVADGRGSVLAINTSTKAVTGTVAVDPSPNALALSPDGKTLYVANFISDESSSNVTVVNTETMNVAATVPVKNPWSLAVSPDGSQVYVVGESGEVSVVDAATRSVVGTVATEFGAGGAVLSPNGKTVYVPGASSVYVIDTATMSVSGTIPDVSGRLAVSPDGKTLYAMDTVAFNVVDVISTSTKAVTGSLSLGASFGLTALAVSPDGHTLFALNANDNTVSALAV